MRRRRERTLTSDEVALWTHVARTVKPFSGRALPQTPKEEPPPQSPDAPIASRMGESLPTKPTRPQPPPLLPLAPIERRTLTALKRGQAPLEAVLDLHGLRQAEAHARLRSFLMQEQARGSRLVLVITGKGAAGDPATGEERGVLKRIVPHWLRMADLRPVVMGFDDAALSHGGSGALYVRLRRLRERTP